MSLASIVAGAPPLFLTRNYLDRFAKNAGGIAVSTGDAYKHRVYDFTRSSKWTSESSTDSVTETYDARLFAASAQISRSVDFLALLNINLKNFLVQYSNDNGGSWATFSGLDYQVGVADFSGTDKLATLSSPVSMNRLKVTMYRTQTANQDKTIGELLVCALNFQPTKGPALYRQEFAENVKTARMHDGSIDDTKVYRSDDSFEFWRAKLRWRGITEAQRDLFLTRKRDPQPLIYMPEPGDRPQDAFLSRFVPGSYSDEYLSLYRAAGFNVEFELEEIGGA